MSLAGDVIHLDPDPVGILEQHRVVAGREAAFLRRVHDGRLELADDEAVDGIDVLAAAGAEAEMMQPRSFLIEGAARPLRGADEDAGPAADPVPDVGPADQRLHAEEPAELAPEGKTAGRIVHRELDVGDAVQVDGHGLLLATAPGRVNARRRLLQSDRIDDAASHPRAARMDRARRSQRRRRIVEDGRKIVCDDALRRDTAEPDDGLRPRLEAGASRMLAPSSTNGPTRGDRS